MVGWDKRIPPVGCRLLYTVYCRVLVLKGTRVGGVDIFDDCTDSSRRQFDVW